MRFCQNAVSCGVSAQANITARPDQLMIFERSRHCLHGGALTAWERTGYLIDIRSIYGNMGGNEAPLVVV